MKKTYVVFIVLILTSCQLLATADADEIFSILIKAYQNSGFNPNVIRTGVAEFEKTVDRHSDSSSHSAVSEKSLQKEEEMIKERFQGDEARMTLELKRIRDSYEESNRRIVQEKWKILMSGTDSTHGGEPGEKYKRRYEKREYVPSLSQWVHTNIDIIFGTLKFSPDVVKSQLNVHWVPNNHDLVVRNESVSFGEFQEFGRFREHVDSQIAFIIRKKLDRKTFALPDGFQEYSENEIQSRGLSVNVVGEIDYDNGAKAQIIEVKKGDKLLEKYHIDIDRGYLCPYQYVATESGDYFIERTAKEYIVEKKSGLYYPSSYREIISRSNGADKTDTEYRLVPDTLRLNHPVSDKEFSIDIPEDSRVTDFRVPDQTVRYVAVKDGTVSLAKGGYDFDKMKWLVREDRLADYVPPTGGMSGWVRGVSTGIGIIMILIALYLIWKKRHTA
jgi:hypothetical protein